MSRSPAAVPRSYINLITESRLTPGPTPTHAPHSVEHLSTDFSFAPARGIINIKFTLRPSTRLTLPRSATTKLYNEIPGAGHRASVILFEIFQRSPIRCFGRKMHARRLRALTVVGIVDRVRMKDLRNELQTFSYYSGN